MAQRLESTETEAGSATLRPYGCNVATLRLQRCGLVAATLLGATCQLVKLLRVARIPFASAENAGVTIRVGQMRHGD
jgi:hypothetical protein